MRHATTRSENTLNQRCSYLSHAVTMLCYLSPCFAISHHAVRRLMIQDIQHDHEGATIIKSTLDVDADPELHVCFSQKYSDQTDRITNEWMPLYTKHFPRASATFLTDEIDPGAAACGTAKFVDAVAEFARAGKTAAAAVQLEAWCPEGESAENWMQYVLSLLQGVSTASVYSRRLCTVISLCPIALVMRLFVCLCGFGAVLLSLACWLLLSL